MKTKITTSILILLILTSIVSASTLKVTSEHPFLLDREWVEAKDLQQGDILKTFDNKKVRITSIKDITLENPTQVYNLEALPYNDFIVEEGLVVHNSNPASERFRVYGKTLVIASPFAFFLGLGIPYLKDVYNAQPTLTRSEVEEYKRLLNHHISISDNNYPYGFIIKWENNKWSIEKYLSPAAFNYPHAKESNFMCTWDMSHMQAYELFLPKEVTDIYDDLLDFSDSVASQNIPIEEKRKKIYEKLQFTLIEPKTDLIDASYVASALKIGEGVCRHKTFTLKKMLERIGEKPKIFVLFSESKSSLGHTWLVLKREDGTKFILDPRNYAGYYEMPLK